MTQSLPAQMTRDAMRSLFDFAGRSTPIAPTDARELEAGGEIAVVLLERSMNRVIAMLEDGCEDQMLMDALGEVSELGWKCFDIFGRLPESSAASSNDSNRSRLLASVQKVRRTHDTIAETLARMKAAFKPVDPATLPAGRASPNAPGYIGMDEFLARFNPPDSA